MEIDFLIIVFSFWILPSSSIENYIPNIKYYGIVHQVLQESAILMFYYIMGIEQP